MHRPDSIPWRKLGYVTAAVLVLFLIFPSTLRILFAADREISYSAGISSNTCDGIASSQHSNSETCRVSYRILLGNTGTETQDSILIHLAPVPRQWRFGFYAQDIVASARPREIPDVASEQDGNRARISISNLQPNRLVNLVLLSTGIESLRILEQTEVTIEADAELIETNPQLTVVSRFFRNLVSVFGF